MLRFGSYLMRFYGKDCKTGLVKIVANLTNSSSSKKRFSNWPIRFPGSNLNSGEITGNVIGSALWKDLTAWARGLSPTSTTRSDAPRRWRARRPLASRVHLRRIQFFITGPFTNMWTLNSKLNRASEYCRAGSNQIVEHSSVNETVLGSSRKPEEAAKHLIDGSEKTVKLWILESACYWKAK